MKFGLGQSAPRVEDRRFISGGGRYTDDFNLPDQTQAYFLRSPYAHARIQSIDIDDALRADGVVAIYTGIDIAASGLGGLPCLVPKLLTLKRPDGNPMYLPPRPLLAKDKVLFVGDYVAVIIAETLNQAKDAAELIDVDYQELPANTATENAMAADCPTVWQDCPDNICFSFQIGDKTAVEQSFAQADHITCLQLPVSRVAVNPMEPRAALGVYDRFEQRYTLYSGNQFPHDLRNWLAQDVLHINESSLRVISPDMGGAFGLRANPFPEQAMVLWAAKQLGRPVKWTADRSEGFVADDHGRDQQFSIELALNKSGDFLALRVKSMANMGAYLSIFGPFPAFGNLGGLAGVYRTPAICVDVLGVFSHSTPIGPYRGAGRPEAAMAIEQIIDQAARELHIDRVELRRRNMIPETAMPFKTGLTFLYDSGKFEENMDKALALADYAGFAQRRAESEQAGKLRGFGIANAIEQSAGLFDEGAEIRFDASGHATVYMGVHSHGQGHETVFRQLLTDQLGLAFEQIRYVQGDTDQVQYGHGTGGSRASGMGGAALLTASQRIVEKGRKIAAHQLEAAVDDIEFSDGQFSIVGTDRRLALHEIAKLAFIPQQLPNDMDSGLQAFATFKNPGPTFPNGCHVSEIEIDPETGVIDILAYSLVDDVGTVMNPALLKGQMHGGITQGIGQILTEQIVWDDDGQLLSGSFMDYAMPRADMLPFFEIEANPVPTPTNPLGIKGAGEAGTVGAMPCLMNAILDALATRTGAPTITMPATPEKVWRTLQQAVNP